MRKRRRGHVEKQGEEVETQWRKNGEETTKFATQGKDDRMQMMKSI